MIVCPKCGGAHSKSTHQRLTRRGVDPHGVTTLRAVRSGASATPRPSRETAAFLDGDDGPILDVDGDGETDAFDRMADDGDGGFFGRLR